MNDLNGAGELYQCDSCEGFFHAACCGLAIPTEEELDIISGSDWEFVCQECKSASEIEQDHLKER